MSHHLKNKSFHLSFSVLFRCLIFILIVYFSINYLSKNKNNSTINLQLGTKNLNVLGVNASPAIINFQQNFDTYRQQAQDYLNQQLINLKKELVTQIYQDVLKSIENANK